jgi:hypothetical protein
MACWFPTTRDLHGQTVDGHLTVRSGKRCGIVFHSAGPTESHAIVQRPVHWTIQIGAHGRIVYQSRAGFVGRDEFVFVRRGRDTRNNPSIRTTRVAVTVTR